MRSDSRKRLKLSYANVVATLALFIALGGTGYAVSQLPKNSVKSKQIAKNAVRSAEVAGNAIRSGEVESGSLLADDFAPGQLPAGQDGAQGPPGPTFAAFDGEGADPVANPDSILFGEEITTPAAGKLLVFFTVGEGSGADGLYVTCSAGNPTAGLYVDGVPVPDTRMNLDNGVAALQSQFGVTAGILPAGVHQIAMKVDCATGSFSTGLTSHNRSFGAILLGG